MYQTERPGEADGRQTRWRQGEGEEKKNTNTSKKHRRVLMKGPAKRSPQLILALVTDCASFPTPADCCQHVLRRLCVLERRRGGKATGKPGSGTDHSPCLEANTGLLGVLDLGWAGLGCVFLCPLREIRRLGGQTNRRL